jgi:hypothetical protein
MVLASVFDPYVRFAVGCGVGGLTGARTGIGSDRTGMLLRLCPGLAVADGEGPLAGVPGEPGGKAPGPVAERVRGGSTNAAGSALFPLRNDTAMPQDPDWSWLRAAAEAPEMTVELRLTSDGSYAMEQVTLRKKDILASDVIDPIGGHRDLGPVGRVALAAPAVDVPSTSVLAAEGVLLLRE